MKYILIGFVISSLIMIQLQLAFIKSKLINHDMIYTCLEEIKIGLTCEKYKQYKLQKQGDE